MRLQTLQKEKKEKKRRAKKKKREGQRKKRKKKRKGEKNKMREKERRDNATISFSTLVLQNSIMIFKLEISYVVLAWSCNF